MSMVSIMVLGAISIVLGGILGGTLNFWLGIVSRSSDVAGKYHIKSLGACFPLLYVLLSWTALVVSVNARYVGEMDIYPVQVPLYYLPGLMLSVLPIPIFGTVLLGLAHRSPKQIKDRMTITWSTVSLPLFTFLSVSLGSFSLAIWPTLLEPLFSWARELGAMMLP